MAVALSTRCFLYFCLHLFAFDTLGEQNIVVNLFVEERTHGVVIALPETQNPHELRDGGLKGHVVGFDEIEVALDALADLVDGHVASFLCNLRRHDNVLCLARPFLHFSVKGVGHRLRNAADTEAFNDDAIVVFKQIG